MWWWLWMIASLGHPLFGRVPSIYSFRPGGTTLHISAAAPVVQRLKKIVQRMKDNVSDIYFKISARFVVPDVFSADVVYNKLRRRVRHHLIFCL